MFDDIERDRIIVEEWIGTEFIRAARQLDEKPDYYLTKVKFTGVNGLVRRKDNRGGAINYIEDSGNIHAIFSLPLVKALDNTSFILFVRLILLTLVFKRNNPDVDYEKAEIEAYNKYVNSNRYVGDVKKIQQVEKTRQIIIFHLLRLSRTSKVFDPEQEIPELSDPETEKKIINAFNKAKTRTLDIDSSKIIKDLKIRSLPYTAFQFIDDKTGDRKISPTYTMLIETSSRKYSSTIILISEIIAKELEEEDIEVIICYEILNVLSERKYNRGKMEREIYDMIAVRTKDIAEKNTAFLYTAKRLNIVKRKTKNLMNEFLKDNIWKMRVVKVY
ncbi:MAG: hypothetical protein ACTSP4_04270 [Candidatus Hodarchaeales archaeon]